MGQETSIEWTESSWNPIRGCSRISQGCVHCYAETQAARWSGPGGPYEGLINEKRRWNGVVRMVPEHLTDPLRWSKPRKVFVNSMSDLFHESLSNEQIAAVFGVMAASPRHTFQVLTKRSERMVEWFKWADGEFAMSQRGIASAPCTHESVIRAAYSFIEEACGEATAKRLLEPHWTKMKEVQDSDHWRSLWPLPNVWVGVSVEDQRVAERVEHLSQVPAAVRWVSAEPLIGRLDTDGPEWAEVDWIVVGGESGPGARVCEAQWIYRILFEAEGYRTPVFVKQLGAAYSDPVDGVAGAQLRVHADAPQPTRRLKHPKGGDMSEWPERLQVRQWPKGGTR
jgi:protein gp37